MYAESRCRLYFQKVLCIRLVYRVLPWCYLESLFVGRVADNLLKIWRARQDSNLWPLPSEGNALSS